MNIPFVFLESGHSLRNYGRENIIDRANFDRKKLFYINAELKNHFAGARKMVLSGLIPNS
jgi:hypothetical protein